MSAFTSVGCSSVTGKSLCVADAIGAIYGVVDGQVLIDAGRGCVALRASMRVAVILRVVVCAHACRLGCRIAVARWHFRFRLWLGGWLAMSCMVRFMVVNSLRMAAKVSLSLSVTTVMVGGLCLVMISFTSDLVGDLPVALFAGWLLLGRVRGGVAREEHERMMSVGWRPVCCQRFLKAAM